MKLQSLLNLIKKMDLPITYTRNDIFEVKGPKYYLTCITQSGVIEDDESMIGSVSISPNGTRPDYWSDYHPGFFPKTLKVIKKYLEMKD